MKTFSTANVILIVLLPCRWAVSVAIALHLKRSFDLWLPMCSCSVFTGSPGTGPSGALNCPHWCFSISRNKCGTWENWVEKGIYWRKTGGLRVWNEERKDTEVVHLGRREKALPYRSSVGGIRDMYWTARSPDLNPLPSNLLCDPGTFLNYPMPQISAYQMRPIMMPTGWVNAFN